MNASDAYRHGPKCGNCGGPLVPGRIGDPIPERPPAMGEATAWAWCIPCESEQQLPHAQQMAVWWAAGAWEQAQVANPYWDLLRHLLTAHRGCEAGCDWHEKAAAARKRLGR